MKSAGECADRAEPVLPICRECARFIEQIPPIARDEFMNSDLRLLVQYVTPEPPGCDPRTSMKLLNH
jgi:hypothetical protein